MKPLVSCIIPVIHEGISIQTAVKRLLPREKSGWIEIIVVDGDTKGSTIRHLSDPSIIKTISLPGRARQLNAGAARACGNILLFLHCDTVLPDNGLATIPQILFDKRFDAGAFDLAIDAKGLAFRIIEKTASVRSRLTRIPYGDQAFFMKKRLFFQMGGFKEIPIMEDVEFMQRLKAGRKKIHLIKKPVQTSARRWKKEGLFYGTLRNWLLMTGYLFGVSPEKLSSFYRNHGG